MEKTLLLITAFAARIAAFQQPLSAPVGYVLNKHRSRLGFGVTHFGIAHVDGYFKDFDVTVSARREDLSDAVIEMTADVDTISTGVDARDHDLQSSAWFDAATFPQASFKSSSLKKVHDKLYKLAGHLTIRGITKPVLLDVVYQGRTVHAVSKKKMAEFQVSGRIFRQDYCIGEGAAAVPVSNEIRLSARLEFIIQ